MTITNCSTCGKEIRRIPSNIARTNHRFCGLDCYNKYRSRNRIILKCLFCGKEFSLKKYQAENRNLHFCSRECSNGFLANGNNFLTDNGIEKMRKDKLGENNPNWKGDKIKVCAGRSRAQHWYPELRPCERCESLKTERHHKDGNTKNNEISNIAFLCRKHHMEIDGRLEKLINKSYCQPKDLELI